MSAQQPNQRRHDGRHTSERGRFALTVVFALVLVGSGAAVAPREAAAQAREPYLQRGTHEEVTVVWRTAGATEGIVCYGTAPTELDRQAASPSARTQHEVRIGGLEPETRYYYSVGATPCAARGGADLNRFFDTAPAPGSPNPFRIWVVGDSGTGATRQAQVRDAMLAATADRRPDIFVHMGDMAYDRGEDAEFTANFYAVYEDILQNTVCWPTMGNHEGAESNSSTQTGPYYEGYVLPSDGRAGGLPSGTEAYYSFDYANVHFVVLDSHESPRSVGGAMLDWLEADLAATAQDWIIAYWHHPPYTKGSHDSDDESQLIQMRENALPILEEYGVDLVLAGHSHIYERSYLVGGAYDTPTRAAGHIIDGGDGRVDGDGAYQRVGPGALYVVAGHGGASVGGSADHPLMFFSERAQGSCLIDVEGDRLTLRNIRYDGVETDVVTLERPGRGLLVTAPTTGQQVLAGSDLEVRWASEGTSGGPVAIDVSLDGGSAWRTLVASTPDDGTHVWTTPARTSESVRVRVRSVEEPEIADESGRFALVDFATREVIGWGSVWEYRDDGQAQDADWVVRTGGWDSGPAQLGYGDGDEATRLRSEEPNIPSVYFRRTVELEGEPVSGELTVLYDDAVAVWVNGTLVYQIHMDNGLGFSSYSGGSGGDDAISGALLDSEALAAFRPGANVVAAMVKQRTSDSSDLSFDLRLNLGVRTELGEGGEDLGAVADATPDLGPADAGRRDLGAADMAHDSGARDTEGDLRAADDSGEDAGGASDLGAEVGDGGLADADVAVLDSSGSGGGEPTTPRGQAGAVTVQSDGCGGCATGGVSRGRPRGASWVLLVALVGAARLVTRRRG